MKDISVSTIRSLRNIVQTCQQLGRHTEIRDLMLDISEGLKVNSLLVHRNSLYKLLKPGGARSTLYQIQHLARRVALEGRDGVRVREMERVVIRGRIQILSELG